MSLQPMTLLMPTDIQGLKDWHSQPVQSFDGSNLVADEADGEQFTEVHFHKIFDDEGSIVVVFIYYYLHAQMFQVFHDLMMEQNYFIFLVRQIPSAELQHMYRGRHYCGSAFFRHWCQVCWRMFCRQSGTLLA